MTQIVRAHTNIALIKYWGKKNHDLKIPFNSSISLTLDKFYTDTKVTYDKTLTEDKLILNGMPADPKRVSVFMDLIRERYNINEFAIIETTNNVPTAAGLASSASAFAALAKAATLHLDLDDESLSRLARMGSGSASRSIFPDFVRWERGHNDETSVASPIEMDAWPEFRMVVCIVNQEEKPFLSSVAMDETVETSPYYDAWVKATEIDGDVLLDALKHHDIEKLGHIAQTNALRMHASLLAINKWYFEPMTIEIMNRVRKIQTEIPAYFTMDAGPNVKIITLDKHVDELLEALPENVETIVCKAGPGITVR